MSHNWAFIISILTLFLLQTVRTDNATREYNPLKLFGYSPRRDLPIHELVEYDGYTCENHTVTTTDGYVLALYRIPRNASCPANDTRPPLIFMHGLYLSGDDCIIPGPGKAHCYQYADACHDVWIPNSRGNRYSRKHVYLNPDKDRDFWNFTFDDFALKDLPATIDYILDNTGKKKVNYVAHSQGVAILILLCAKNPEYNDKINAGVGLSVTAHLEHSRFLVIPIQGFFAGLTDYVRCEIFGHGKFVQSTGELLCGLSELEYPFCSVLIFAALGYNKFQISQKTLQALVGHTPAGTSCADFARWGQCRKNGFAEFDHGALSNLIKYGKVKPPLFDLSAVSMPWYFIGSKNDYVGDLRDIAKLQSQLSNVELCVLKDEYFGHLDFIYGDDIPNYITPKVLSVFEGGPFICDNN